MSASRRVVGGGAVLLLVLGLAAALTAIGDGDDRLPPTRSRPAAAPEGSLRVGVSELPATYDPFDVRSRTPAANQILGMVLPQLFDVAPDGTVRGRLVDEDSIETRGLTARFRFVEGARWSDGTPITAADLQFTLEVIRGEQWPGPAAGYDRIESIAAEASGAVTVRFSERLPGWKRLFSGEDYVLPRHRLEGQDLAEAWRTGPDLAGGPYVLEGSNPGLDAVLSANPEWWGEGPGVADLQVLTVPDATTLFQLYDRGELDVVWMPAYTERTPQLEALEGDLATAPPGGRLLSVYLDAGDVREELRVAALDLVDRTRFTEVLLEGEADIATSWGFLDDDPGWPTWVIDPSKAARAGRAELPVLVPEEEPMASLLARTVQRRARQTSLTFDAVELGNDLFDGEWLPQGKFALAIADEIQWPRPCWRCRFGSDAIGETNWSRIDDVDDLAGAADAGDEAAAARLERALQERAVLLPLWRPAAAVISRGVEGIEANAWSPGPFSRVERWKAGGS